MRVANILHLGIKELRGLARPAVEQTVSAVQSCQEFGGLAGRFLLAFLAVRFVSRRKLDPVLALFDFPNPNSTSEQPMNGIA
jgi:hypothetical protein